jgi:hypothetical protein
MAIGLCGAAVGNAAFADSYTGTAWTVHFNLPDQTTSTASIGTDEFVNRDAFLARIDALASNDWACLATFTFSGNTAAVGAAGPILVAVSNALARGAKMGFVVDNGVNVTSNYWPGISLSSLAAQAGNHLELSRSPADGGITHDKMGVFWYRTAGQAWVLSGSWNFTGGASSQQWNVLVEIQDNTLGAACSNEMRELLSGRFHSSTNKSHAHDGTHFRLADMARDGWIRFAPYPDGKYGGNNALTDITNAIDAAQQEIFFGLNKLTRPNVVEALIRACNRGVIVHGVIPLSDRGQEGQDSYEMYQMLIQPTNYATRNHVRMYEAYYNAARTRYDNNNRDLVHAKYLLIDPRGTNPIVIQGSANWTASALVLTSSNDENLEFLPHRGIAEAFRAQFAAMTDGMKPWSSLRMEGSPAAAWLDYWLPEDLSHELVSTENLRDASSWTNRVQLLPAVHGTNTLSLPQDADLQFFRVQPVP